jgi:hypothetical protein
MDTFMSTTQMETSRTRRTVGQALASLALGALVLGSALTPASAAVARSPLVRISGEDPTIPGSDPAFVTAGDVRQLDASTLKVTLGFLDASRFPAGCNAEVVAGSFSSKAVPLVLLVPDALHPANPLGPTTDIDMKAAGVIQPGQTANVKINCQFIDANGVQQRHQTQWQAKF